jgi:hypothetical protein
MAVRATSLGRLLAFTRLPIAYFVFLIPVPLTCLALGDVAKRQVDQMVLML